MEEKITSTAAQTFRNLKRMRAVVDAVRELASEVDAEGAADAPAEELPKVISEGIVSRIAALEGRKPFAGFLPVFAALTKEEMPAEMAREFIVDEVLEEPQQFMFGYVASLGRCFAFTMDDGMNNLVAYSDWRGYDEYRQEVSPNTLFFFLMEPGFYLYVEEEDVFYPASLTESDLEEVRSTANSAYSLANTANNTANTAKTNASMALTTANAAKSTASTASTNASSALTKANAAKTTADTAQTTANTAKNTANTAKTTANTAKTTADKALALAEDSADGKAIAETICAIFNTESSSFSLRGSFAADSTEDDWWWKAGSKESIAEYVNADTKEFAILPEQITRRNDLGNRFQNNAALVSLTQWPLGLKPTSLNALVCDCSGLIELDLSGLDLSENQWFTNMALRCKNLSRVNLSGIDTSKVKGMTGMLNGCKITEVDVSSFDTRNVETMNSMFQECRSLTSLDMSSFDLGKCTTVGYLCANDVALKSVVAPHNTGNIQNFSAMFSCCYALAELDVSGFDTSSATQMGDMFRGVKVEEFDLRGWDTSKVTGMAWMFYNCSKLKRLLLGVLDLSNVTTVDDMFHNCSALADVTGEIRGLKVNINLSACPLTNESAMVFINGLVDVGAPRTITFSSATYATLTDEQFEVATAKGWTVASPDSSTGGSGGNGVN